MAGHGPTRCARGRPTGDRSERQLVQRLGRGRAVDHARVGCSAFRAVGVASDGTAEVFGQAAAALRRRGRLPRRVCTGRPRKVGRPAAAAAPRVDPKHHARYPTDNAVDGNEQSFWVSDGTKPGEGPTKQKPEWLQFEFIEPITVNTLHLIPRTPFGPRQIEVQVSQDGQDFVAVKAFSLTAEPSFELSFPPTTSRIFRILITDSYATENTQVCEAWWDDRKPDGRVLLLALKTGRDSSPRWSPNGSIRELVDAPLPKLELAAGDAPIGLDEIVDLTATLRPDGQLDWDVPEGPWTIVRTGYTITGAASVAPALAARASSWTG